VGETAKKTLVAAVPAWLLTRALRRLVGFALIAAVAGGGLTIADRRGVDADIDRVRGVVRCEMRAITRAAKQLRDGAKGSSPNSRRRTRRAVRGLGQCHLTPASTGRHRGGGGSR
jgi:hypothetical protein